jgi:tyrosine-protein phosphatase YwqE
MRPNLYEASRTLATAGFTAQIHFNPSEVTNRLKKSIQKQIEACSLTGGYSSHASRIAKRLMEQENIPFSRQDWSSLFVQYETKEAREQAVAIINADLAAYILDDPSNNNKYLKNRAAESIEEIQRGESSYLRIHHKEFSKQLRQLMTDTRTPELVAKAKALAKRLDDPTPIKITIKDWS